MKLSEDGWEWYGVGGWLWSKILGVINIKLKSMIISRQQEILKIKLGYRNTISKKL